MSLEFDFEFWLSGHSFSDTPYLSLVFRVWMMKITDTWERIIEFLVLEFCEVELNEIKHRPVDDMEYVLKKWLYHLQQPSLPSTHLKFCAEILHLI